MLTEKEKKAIKMMEIIVDECELDNKRNGYEGTYYDGDTPIPYKEYKTILNLITKLQKENEELSEKNIENICKGVEEEVLQEYRDKITKLQKRK